MGRLLAGVLCILFVSHVVVAQADGSSRVLSGVVLTVRDEAVTGVTILVTSPSGDLRIVSDSQGAFRLAVPAGTMTLKLSGKNIIPVTMEIGPGRATENLRLVIEYVVPPIHESVVIVAMPCANV